MENKKDKSFSITFSAIEIILLVPLLVTSAELLKNSIIYNENICAVLAIFLIYFVMRKSQSLIEKIINYTQSWRDLCKLRKL